MSQFTRRFEVVEIEKLHSGLAYQRPINENFVREKIANFDPTEVEIPSISLRIKESGESEYRVIDGQHTIAIIKGMGWIKIKCEIREGLSDEDEHKWFHQKNAKKRPQSSSRLLNAAIHGKFDETTNRLISSLDMAGYKIKAVDVSGTRGVINAGESIKRIFTNMDEKDFTKCMMLHSSTWAGEKKALTASFLKGICKFYNTYKDKIDTNRFVNALSEKKITVNEIIKEADSDTYYKDLGVKYARILTKYYNKDLRTENKRLKISLLED
jgi:hypothetical protein